MKIEEFRKHGYELIDWIAHYYTEIEDFPVKSQVQPGEIYLQLPPEAPEAGEDFKNLMQDFDKLIMPGITHWQHPSFFAYFNANNSFPSILGELLTSAIGAQCMIWETSPAAAELEQQVCEWVRDAFGLPGHWTGVIQDTASTATLVALLMARERHTGFAINKHGFSEDRKYVIYVSSEAHSSIEKGAKIAGFGSEQVVKIAVDDKLAMAPDALERQIETDKRAGLTPLCVIAAVGTTGTHAMDPIRKIGGICQQHALFFHVDAAHAGNATILDEFRYLIDGLELADSYVFNPHKWMFTNFDCSLFYTSDQSTLVRTFEIMPEYLKTDSDSAVNNYRDWGIQLGRRFRALKLWFVLRSYGLEGIRQRFRHHIALARELSARLENDPGFEVMAPVPLNLVCFRYIGSHGNEQHLDTFNIKLERLINNSGKAYITHTRINEKYTLRACIGQTNVDRRHVDQFFDLVKEKAAILQD
jgi:aromatic-L-amino-acid decarboxylase